MSTPALAAATVVLAVSDIARAAQQITLGGGPQYLRDANGIGVIDRLGLAVVRGACRRYAANPGALPPDTAANYERACRPYLESIGYGPGPGVRLPFRGGQCNCRRYRVQVRIEGTSRQTGNPFVRTFDGFRWGPIGRIQFVASSFEYRFTSRGFANQGSNVPGCGPVGSVDNIAIGFPSDDSRVVLFRVTPDGHADECGNLPPDVDEPQPQPDTRPNPEPVNPGPNWDVDVFVQVNAIGAIIVDFGIGPIVIDPFNGDGDGDGGSGGGRPPGDIGEPSAPQSASGEGDAEGEAPSGKVLGALRVEFVTVPRNAKEYAPGIYRGAFYAYLGTEAGLDHDPAGAMATDRQLILPERDNLTHWRVKANQGYVLRVTPFYLDVES